MLDSLQTILLAVLNLYFNDDLGGERQKLSPQAFILRLGPGAVHSLFVMDSSFGRRQRLSSAGRFRKLETISKRNLDGTFLSTGTVVLDRRGGGGNLSVDWDKK